MNSSNASGSRNRLGPLPPQTALSTNAEKETALLVNPHSDCDARHRRAAPERARARRPHRHTARHTQPLARGSLSAPRAEASAVSATDRDWFLWARRSGWTPMDSGVPAPSSWALTFHSRLKSPPKSRSWDIQVAEGLSGFLKYWHTSQKTGAGRIYIISFLKTIF